MSGDVTRREFVAGAAAAAGAALGAGAAGASPPAEKDGEPAKILNYNPEMEYRRLGKTGIKVSAVCLGGHWKRLQTQGADFDRNRADVVSKCIEVGINYVDACVGGEVMAYAKALKGRRDKMYFGYSWYEREMRNRDWQTAKKLLEGLEIGLKEAGLEHVDLWRVTMYEPGRNHTEGHVQETLAALEKARKDGKARFAGMSSHDREWFKDNIEKHPEFQVVLTPYTAGSTEKPKDSLFAAARRCDVGILGIKPFADNRLFRGTGQDGDPLAKDDDERARLALRYILSNDAISAPIPGLISVRQVENAALAVRERRKLDKVETAKLEEAVREMWAKVDGDYAWLRDWRCV